MLRRGFTLLEAMTVCAILGIVTALAVNSFQSAITQARNNDGVLGVYGQLLTARKVARAHNQPVRLVFLTDAGTPQARWERLPCDNQTFGIGCPSADCAVTAGCGTSGCPCGDMGPSIPLPGRRGPERLGRALLPGWHRPGRAPGGGNGGLPRPRPAGSPLTARRGRLISPTSSCSSSPRRANRVCSSAARRTPAATDRSWNRRPPLSGLDSVSSSRHHPALLVEPPCLVAGLVFKTSGMARERRPGGSIPLLYRFRRSRLVRAVRSARTSSLETGLTRDLRRQGPASGAGAGSSTGVPSETGASGDPRPSRPVPPAAGGDCLLEDAQESTRTRAMSPSERSDGVMAPFRA